MQVNRIVALVHFNYFNAPFHPIFGSNLMEPINAKQLQIEQLWDEEMKSIAKRDDTIVFCFEFEHLSFSIRREEQASEREIQQSVDRKKEQYRALLGERFIVFQEDRNMSKAAIAMALEDAHITLAPEDELLLEVYGLTIEHCVPAVGSILQKELGIRETNYVEREGLCLSMADRPNVWELIQWGKSLETKR